MDGPAGMVNQTAKPRDRGGEPAHAEALGRSRWFAPLLAALSMFALGIDHQARESRHRGGTRAFRYDASLKGAFEVTPLCS